MRVAVTGAAGRLGGAVVQRLGAAGHHVFPLTRRDLDIRDAAHVAAVMQGLRPGAIVNCSAYNAVDAAESDAEAAYAVNAGGPANLAAVAAELGAVLVHYSTDFVFDGAATVPYGEHDETRPLSVYGASKLAGEVEARKAPRHYVLRVESLFGGQGVNGHRATIDYITATLAEGKAVRALVDRTVTLSYVPDVADVTTALLGGGVPYGTYHCVNSGVTTWFELAVYVASRLGLPGRVEPLTVTELKTVAARPKYCALSNAKLAAAGIQVPDWQSAVERHLAGRAAGAAAGLIVESLPV